MSLDLVSCAVGFSALYGNIVVAYSSNSSPACLPAAAVSQALGTVGLLPISRSAGEGSSHARPLSARTAANNDGAERPAAIAADAAAKLADNMLSRRQRDVLTLIVQGRSNKEIARALNLAEGTVKIHVAALFSKLGVHRRAAVAIAGAQFLSAAAPQAPSSERRTFNSRPRPAARPGGSAGSDSMAIQDAKLRHPRRYNSAAHVGLLRRP
jgi:DNA-binding CsgD family transcriptional regulator